MSEKQKKNLKIWGGVATFIGVLMMFGDSSFAGFVITFFGVVLFILGYKKTVESIKTPQQIIEEKPSPAEKASTSGIPTQWNHEVKGKHILGILAVSVVTIAIMVMSGLSSSTPNTQPTQPTVSLQEKQNAQKELDELITLSKRAGLVSSYEFSSTANVLYVSDAWYTQDVAFKKDFMAKIATLKKTITGYQRFELRDRRTDEKVAEVTGFSGTLEIYK